MLTLATLLPSDNEAILGRSERFYAPLLRASDNKPILLRRFYALHYIECAFLLYFYILYFTTIYHIIVYLSILYHTIIYSMDKYSIQGQLYTHMRKTPPPPKKMDPLFTGGPNHENGNCQK